MGYERALCFVDMLSLKNKTLYEKVRGENIYVSCLEDKNLSTKFYKCEIASLSYVLALFCRMSEMGNFQDLDEGYLGAESCLGEEEASEILDFLEDAKYLIVDGNINSYKDSENIKYFLNFLSQKYKLKILDSNEKGRDFKNAKLSISEKLDSYDSLVLFKVNLKDDNLRCSKQFLQIAECKDKSEIEVLAKDFSLKTALCLDENLQGTMAFLNYDQQGFDFTPIRIKEIK